MAYTFDGQNKLIILPSGMVTLDLIDLHSRWKDWVLAGNASCLPAFGTVGGDIAEIPLYLFIRNGWVVIPQSADHTLSVTNGIFVREGGGDPFGDPVGTYKIRINRQIPGIAIGYSTSGVPAPTAAEVAAAVWVKQVEGVYTAEQIMRLMSSVLAGKVSGAGTGTEVFRDMNDLTDRAVVTVDSFGNRTGVVTNVS